MLCKPIQDSKTPETGIFSLACSCPRLPPSPSHPLTPPAPNAPGQPVIHSPGRTGRAILPFLSLCPWPPGHLCSWLGSQLPVFLAGTSAPAQMLVSSGPSSRPLFLRLSPLPSRIKAACLLQVHTTSPLSRHALNECVNKFTTSSSSAPLTPKVVCSPWSLDE